MVQTCILGYVIFLICAYDRSIPQVVTPCFFSSLLYFASPSIPV